MSSRYSHNMVNFGPLAAETGLPVWGTPANFKCFRVLAALLQTQQSSSGHPQKFAALNRGRHLCSAGRRSRWALAHILVVLVFPFYDFCVACSALTLLVGWQEGHPAHPSGPGKTAVKWLCVCVGVCVCVCVCVCV